MSPASNVRDVQGKILEIMKFIDRVCRKNEITYYIMGGTALGAVRHGGFIPWDDDLDIFMTPDQYERFKSVFDKINSEQFVLQEWRTTPDYLEYAKVRMNGTTFIEKNFVDWKNMHQGIYVDIMILHKVPENQFLQKLIYIESKYVTLYAITHRGWKAKSKAQQVVVTLMKFLPNKLLLRRCYRRIYRYDDRKCDYKYCYWITPGKFRNGLFCESFFEEPADIPFEDTVLMCSRHIKEYLAYRYGDYMKLPSEEEQKLAVHAYIYDVGKNYTEYL